MMSNKYIKTLLQKCIALLQVSLPCKRLIIFCLLLFAVVFDGYSQQFGNEWIRQNQTYFKITVGADGIYRISYTDLQQAGFPVNSIDPRRIQLFFRGKEQSIMVQGQQDARFDQQDYILFYGKHNDGTLDTELYVPQEAQPHPYHSLYSDSAAYFLTWRLDAANGKRVTSFSENNVDGLPAELYHPEEKRLLLTSEYSLGRKYPIGSSLNSHLSTFDYGEGWTGPRIQNGKSVDYTMVADRPFTSGNKPHLEVLLAGRNNQSHKVMIQIGTSANTLRNLTEVTFDYFDNKLLSQIIEWSDIGSGQLVVRVTPLGVNNQADNISVSYIKLTYPRLMDAAQQERKPFTIKATTAGKAYIEISNPPTEPVLWDITNPDEPINIGFNNSSSKISAIIPETWVDRQLFVGKAYEGISIRKVNFNNIDPAATFLIISHPLLHQASGGYTDPVKAYGDYRASAAGGSFKVLSVDIQQLFDQFSYGVVSPLAVRRFADYMLTKGNPQYLLMIGKGLTVDYNFYRKDPSLTTVQDLVLPGGMPGSDAVFTVGLRGSDGINPAIPTGRINARTAAEVVAYLNKVKEQESRTLQADYMAPNTREALWKKHLVHLSGGVTVSELKLFSIYVDQFKEKATGDFLGGKVSTLSKTTNNATELINIADEVNKGLSLITFFGHSSTTRTDIEIGYVSNDELGYRNKGKYPAILVNGCNAGNIFSNAFTFGEDWIITPDRGALNVVAHSGEGLSNILKVYSGNFYEAAFQDSTLIAQSIGRIKLEADKKFIQNLNGTENEVHIANMQQMVLQGDPFVKLFGKGKPDFELNNNNVFLTPFDDGPVTAYSDSFAIKMIVKNFGITTGDSIAISVNRTLNSGKVVTYGPVNFPAILYEDTLTFVIRADESIVQKREGFGNNHFEVVLDGADAVKELNENNNRASIEYAMPLGGTVNILPYNFSIVNQVTVLLQAQPGDLQGAMQENVARTFLFEADTSINFDSPLKMQFNTDAVSLANWPLALPVVQDSTVYYWRTKFAELREGEIDAWSQNTFTYIGGSAAGWAQLKADQLKQNEISQQIYENGKWKFIETSIDIDITTYGANEQDAYPELLISGKRFLYTSVGPLLCRNNSINGVAFETESLRPYLGIPPKGFDDNDPNNCGPLPQVVNTFSNAQVLNTLILEQYIDGVKDGDAVLLFSIGQVDFQSWPASTLAKLQEIGVGTDDITNLQDGEPIIILGRKHAEPGSAQVIRADPNGTTAVTEQSISLQEEITGQYSSGSILSRRIGPASAWFSLQHLIQEVEENVDEVTCKVIAETLTGNQTILHEDIAGMPQVDLSQVDASQYPYLRLEYSVKDKINFTPPQLKKWWVTYTGVPEGVILIPNAQPLSVERQEGQSEQASFGFYNIADVGFSDSVSVIYTFFNQDSRKSETDTLRLVPLAAGDTAMFHIPIHTIGRTGINDLRINANPHLLREQSYDNNQLSLTSFLTVRSDKTHPVVDVAFDGIYIMDGDIVSPNPMITIELRDENPYLLKQDTSGIHIYLGKVEDKEAAMKATHARIAANQAQKIDLSGKNISWTPATEDQPFKIVYQPETLADGIYTLRVQAKDVSGNAAGAAPYEINFEVINASTITHFYPYPNPFSTSTRFVFTLTGSEIPDQLKIQVMTVSGKIVREITQDEIGTIRIGNNISAYAWDGRDEFGDKLANGVYLYRIIIRSEGKEIEHRKTAADRAFKHGFGKLYILR